MNSNADSQNLADFSEETEETETSESISIDEFFRQLEEKEKDLHISPEMVIEIEDDDEAETVSNELEEIEIPEPSLLSVEPEKVEPPVVFQDDISSRLEALTLRNEVSKLQTQITRIENERAEMFETTRRRHSEFENYKNRTEREREENLRNQKGHLAFQILPVLDNMHRALDSTKNFSEEKSTEFQQFFEGIELVNQQLKGVLTEMGVEPIAAVGENFDPHLHEAVATEVTEAVASNTVTEELMRGYRLGEKIIRPSMVKVSVSSNSGNLPQNLSISEENLDTTE